MRNAGLFSELTLVEGGVIGDLTEVVLEGLVAAVTGVNILP